MNGLSPWAVYTMLVGNILLLVSGQLVWKQALIKMGGLSVTGLLTSPGVYIGGMLYVIATGLWLVILNNAKLSVVYPMQSLAYVIGMLAAFFLFQETVPLKNWIGAAIIIVGVWLIAVE
ncbi:MAG TPA: EamA family transporter [Bacilli bacterium]|nr:EamA family transporter [Bacilli bacterium]